MSDDVVFDQLWSDAVDRYIVTTNRTAEDKKLLLAVTKVEDLFVHIDQETTKFNSFRKKGSRFRDALKKVVQPFTALSEIASSAISLSPFAPASTILGAVVFLIKAAGGVSDSYDWLESLFESLGSFTERLEQYVGVDLNEHLRLKIIGILTCLLEIFARTETIIKTGRFKKYTAVIFLGQDNEVKSSFDKLRKLFDDEHELVQAITYTTTQRIEQEVNNIEESTKMTLEVTEQMQKQLDDLSTKAKSLEVKTLLDDNLLTAAHRKNIIIHHEYLESVIENTGSWLLDDNKVIMWREKQTPILWVFGGPGTGKSCLSSALIQTLREEYPQDPKHPNRTSVAYFFTKEDSDLHSLLDLLKSLAYQIAQNDMIFKVFAAHVLSKPDSVATPKLLWKNLFLRFYSQSRDISNDAMIVLDGLDEAPRSMLKELCSLFEDIIISSRSGLRLSFALFSRPDLSEYLEPKYSRVMVKVAVENRNQSDIAEYVKKRLTGVLVVKQTRQLRDKKAAAKLARTFRDKVLEKADGMFFKVVLIMDQIQEKERTSAVFEAIEEAPPQLDAMIAHVFDKLMLNEDVDKEDLNELLLWVAYAKSWITMAQLYAILMARTGTAYDALEARLRGRFASIFKLSGGGEPPELSQPTESNPGILNDDDTDGDDFDIDDISEDEEDEPKDKDGLQNTTKHSPDITGGFSKDTLKRFFDTSVRFTHASIRDFLVQPRDFHLDTHTGSIPIHIDARLADLRIAKSCMRRIILFGTNHNTSQGKPDYINYATRTWMDHLRSTEEVNLTEPEKSEVVKIIVSLFTDPTACHGWILAMAKCRYYAKMLHMFKNPAFARMIADKWLSTAKQNDYTTEQWDWIQKSMTSSKELFRPLARAAAKLWLTRTGPGDPLYEEKFFFTFFLWVVWAWASLNDDGFSGAERLSLDPFFSWNYPEFNDEIYHKVMESVDFKVTQYWYCAQGWLMFKTGQPDRGAALFSKALELDPLCWDALGGLGHCWQEKKFDDAYKLIEKAIKNIPTNLKDAGTELKSMLLCFFVERKDYEAAANIAAESYTAEMKSSADFQVKMVYIMALYELKQYDRIHDIMLDLSKLSVRDGMTQFLGFLRLPQQIGVSLRMHGDITQITKPWVEELCSPAISLTMLATMPWVMIWLATFMLRYYPTSDDAIECFERIAAPSFLATLGEEVRPKYVEFLDDIEGAFMGIYVDKAQQALSHGQDSKEYVEKLRKFSIADERSNLYKINAASICLGSYWRQSGEEEAIWKPCIRPMMLHAIDMLCDDDPGNDVAAYSKITTALVGAGDLENAIAANIPFGLGLTYPEYSDKIVEKGHHMVMYTCDGECSKSSHEYKEVWCCESCYDTEFCEDCIKLVRSGKMLSNVCNKDHKFFQYLPAREDLRTRAVTWDAETEMIQINKEWLDDLRKKWET